MATAAFTASTSRMMTTTAWISGDEDMRLDINLLGWGWGWDKKKPRGLVVNEAVGRLGVEKNQAVFMAIVDCLIRLRSVKNLSADG